MSIPVLYSDKNEILLEQDEIAVDASEEIELDGVTSPLQSSLDFYQGRSMGELRERQTLSTRF